MCNINLFRFSYSLIIGILTTIVFSVNSAAEVCPISESGIVRVGLTYFKNSSVVILSSSKPIEVYFKKKKLTSGLVFQIEKNRQEYRLNGKSYSELIFINPGNEIVSVSDSSKPERQRLYTGNIEFKPDRDRKMNIINVLDLETYLLWVVPAELELHFPLEAHKVQAVLSRTYLLTNQFRHIKDDFHICDSNHCQVYHGINKKLTQNSDNFSKIFEAVNSTRELILSYQGKVARVFYHSTSPGKTRNASDAWGGNDIPYLTPRNLPLSKKSPYFNWNLEIESSQLQSILQSAGLINNGRQISSIKIKQRDQSRFNKSLEIKLNRNEKIIVSTGKFASAINRNSGKTVIRSHYFSIRTTTRNRKKYFLLEGQGFGHGVGFCQWSVGELAEKGNNYQNIINYFTKGTNLESYRNISVSTNPEVQNSDKNSKPPKTRGIFRRIMAIFK